MNIKVKLIRDVDYDGPIGGNVYHPGRIDTEHFAELLKWFCKTKLSEFPMPPDELLEKFVDQFVKEQSGE